MPSLPAKRLPNSTDLLEDSKSPHSSKCWPISVSKNVGVSNSLRLHLFKSQAGNTHKVSPYTGQVSWRLKHNFTNYSFHIHQFILPQQWTPGAAQVYQRSGGVYSNRKGVEVEGDGTNIIILSYGKLPNRPYAHWLCTWGQHWIDCAVPMPIVFSRIRLLTIGSLVCMSALHACMHLQTCW